MSNLGKSGASHQAPGAKRKVTAKKIKLTEPSIVGAGRIGKKVIRSVGNVRVVVGPGSKKTIVWGPQGFIKVIDGAGNVVIERVADMFGMSKMQVAETVGLKPSSVHKSERLFAPKPQIKMREMLEVVDRVTEWAGGQYQAMAWYRSVPIPAFGGRTAESLVKDGKATAVRDYLDSLALGGFA